MFSEISNSFGLGVREKVCQRYPAGILNYMTMKSMILFKINYHKPEVKHKIRRNT